MRKVALQFSNPEKPRRSAGLGVWIVQWPLIQAPENGEFQQIHQSLVLEAEKSVVGDFVL